MIERYTREAAGRIWSQENRYRAWLAVELAVCDAWAELGRVPAEAAKNIRARAEIDVERIGEIEKVTRHDVIAFLSGLEEKVGPDARFIHLGLTSSDVLDTANALLIREAGELIIKDLDLLLETLKRLVGRNRGVLCVGRTHGVHAEPTSFGLKLAGFYAEFVRHRKRFERALEGLAVGKISGAVGTYAFLSPELEKLALAKLGLRPDVHSTQIVQRDRYAEFFAVLAIMGGGIERLALELRHLQRTEVLEAEEGFARGQKGSSAMPHKKNPISAENLCGISRLLRGYALSSFENQALWHERDISHSSVERVIMPDATILTDYALARLNGLLENLVIHADRMLENFNFSRGLYFSQRLLLALMDAGMARQEAYELTQGLAMRSWETGTPFAEVVAGDETISRLLKDALKDIFDPAWYLRYEDYVLNRVFSGDGG